MKQRLTTTFVLACLLVLWNDAFASFAQPSLMPTERLLERAHAHLKVKPEDAQAHYVVGRVHYLAFYNRASAVASYGQLEAEGLPIIAPYWTAEQGYLYQARKTEALAQTLKKFGVKSLKEVPQDQTRDFYQQKSALTQELVKQEWKPEQEEPGVAAEHATLALKAFDKAIDLDPENSLYLLGKASLLEQAKAFYTGEKPKRVDPVLSKITLEQIRDGYYRAYAIGLESALKLEARPVAGLRSIASYEAGSAYVRLCKEGSSLTDTEKKRLAEVKEKLGELDKLRRGAITPIIFSLKNDAVFSDLLEPGKKVGFDLDGDGVVETWPWVRKDTGFLVWDPARSGRILSGRQLFGSYTWQIPFENGYEPLAMLDRNGDDQLTGAELDGIRAWFDRDGSGGSEPGEVVDLSSLGIESIATSATQTGSIDSNIDGLQLKSGETRPSWDWVPGR